MADVASILETKGSDVLRIEGSATVLDAVKRMVEANVGSLLVDEDGSLAGIVTERDYLRRVTLEGRDENDTPVRDIMTSPLVYVTPDTSIDECMAVMTERRIRHLPVLTGDRKRRRHRLDRRRRQVPVDSSRRPRSAYSPTTSRRRSRPLLRPC